MGKLNYYSAKKISDTTTLIRSLTGELLYLVEGDDKAVLIDTALGVGHLKEFVENLTCKPISVIITHGHVDHAMGAPEFDAVYMNSADEKVYREHNGLEVRKNYIQMTLRDKMPKISDADYVQPQDLPYINLNHGDTFDLGGITLGIYSASGHTKGSMAVLINEQRKLLLGDACNPNTFLFDENSLTVEDYMHSLQMLDKQTKGKYDGVYLSHVISDAPMEMIESAIELCGDILNGNVDDAPFEFMGHIAHRAKNVGRDMKRVDGGIANIIYNKARMWHKDA